MAALAEPQPLARRAPPSTQEERDRREYRHTFAWVLGVHLFALLLFGITAVFRPVKKQEQIAWLLGGEVGGGDAVAATETTTEIEAAPEPEAVVPEPEIETEPEPPTPPLPLPEPPAPSELVIPQATPVPATPKPATPRPATPRPSTPKPAPATPKPGTPKLSTPKPATPQPGTPKPLPSKATPKAAVKNSGAKTEKAAKAADGPVKSSPGSNTPPSGAASGSGKGTGRSGSGPGSGAASEFGGYFTLLRDRYYAVWDQPVSLDRSSGDLITTLRIKARRDGTILGYEIVKGSGNSVMDGSVLAAAQQVTKIDPIPPGLGREDVLEIPINFKLDQGQ